MTDQENVGIGRVEAVQAPCPSFSRGEIQLVLDHRARSGRKLGEDQVESLSRPPGGRTENKIDRAELGRQMFADAPRRLTATAAQWALVILNILFGARFGVPEQVQHLHLR